MLAPLTLPSLLGFEAVVIVESVGLAKDRGSAAADNMRSAADVDDELDVVDDVDELVCFFFSFLFLASKCSRSSLLPPPPQPPPVLTYLPLLVLSMVTTMFSSIVGNNSMALLFDLFSLRLLADTVDDDGSDSSLDDLDDFFSFRFSDFPLSDRLLFLCCFSPASLDDFVLLLFFSSLNVDIGFSPMLVLSFAINDGGCCCCCCLLKSWYCSLLFRLLLFEPVELFLLSSI